MASGYSKETPKGHYNRDVKVPESVIEEIRALGMEKAIKKAKEGGASPEFIEGVRRFYPAAIEGIEAAGVTGGSSGGNAPKEGQDSPQRDIAAPPQDDIPPPEVAPPATRDSPKGLSGPVQDAYGFQQQPEGLAGPPAPPPELQGAVQRALGGRGAEAPAGPPAETGVMANDGQMSGSLSPYSPGEPRERQGLLAQLGLSPENAGSFPSRLVEALGNIGGAVGNQLQRTVDPIPQGAARRKDPEEEAIARRLGGFH